MGWGREGGEGGGGEGTVKIITTTPGTSLFVQFP